MEQQALKDVPRTEQEYRRQKGPVPKLAIFLVIGLLAVFGLFFGAPLMEALFGDGQ